MSTKSPITSLVKCFDWLMIQPNWKRFHQIIEQVAAECDGLFFIQIGANDGVIHDPIYRYVVQDDWQGILVEPVRYYYDRLKENYHHQANLIFENVAISDCDEKRDFYYIQEGVEHLPGWSRGLGSFYRDVLLKHKRVIPDIEQYIVHRKVQCISLTSLLAKHRVGSVDLLMMDTEGYDFELLKQVDFSRIMPKVIVYEHKHLSRSDRYACRTMLAEHGYIFSRHFSNTMAYLEKA